jgi:hypothetical protein
MKAKATIALLAATAFAALLLPGAAIARTRPASRQTAPEVSAQFALQGTNGFQFGVSVTDRRLLTVGALKFGNVIQVVTYKQPVHPRRGSDRIVAGLGKLGRIDVRFVPGKVHREKPPKGCHGPKTVVEQGHFVGVIAFHGETGFTEVHAHWVAGTITRTPAFRCPAPAAPPNLKKFERELEALENEGATDEAKEAEEEEEAEIEALSVGLSAKARGGQVTLSASKTAIRQKHGKGFAITSISVLGDRRLGRIEENSAAVYVFGKGSTFLVPNRKRPASEGILKPPAPFSGSGTFRRHPLKPPTWTGDLKVALPGFGQVRLAGPGTHASMCEGAACGHRGAPSAQSLLRRLTTTSDAFVTE